MRVKGCVVSHHTMGSAGADRFPSVRPGARVLLNQAVQRCAIALLTAAQASRPPTPLLRPTNDVCCAGCRAVASPGRKIAFAQAEKVENFRKIFEKSKSEKFSIFRKKSRFSKSEKFSFFQRKKYFSDFEFSEIFRKILKIF